MQRPTCTNLKIRSIHDAHKIFYAVKRNILHLVTRRLDADERQALGSGCIYAWEERGPNAEVTGLGIERFTEGRRWSPSRVREEFLFYYEKWSPPAESNSSSADRDKEPPRDWDPLVKQTYSVFVETDKGRRKWHLTSYFTQSTVDRLGTVDDLPGVGDVEVPESIFTSTRVVKARKADEGGNGRTGGMDVLRSAGGGSSSVNRTYSAFPVSSGPLYNSSEISPHQSHHSRSYEDLRYYHDRPPHSTPLSSYSPQYAVPSHQPRHPTDGYARYGASHPPGSSYALTPAWYPVSSHPPNNDSDAYPSYPSTVTAATNHAPNHPYASRHSGPLTGSSSSLTTLPPSSAGEYSRTPRPYQHQHSSSLEYDAGDYSTPFTSHPESTVRTLHPYHHQNSSERALPRSDLPSLHVTTNPGHHSRSRRSSSSTSSPSASGGSSSDSGVGSSRMIDGTASYGPGAASTNGGGASLVPLRTLLRTHPYRRDPVDDRALRRLDPTSRPATSS